MTSHRFNPDLHEPGATVRITQNAGYPNKGGQMRMREEALKRDGGRCLICDKATKSAVGVIDDNDQYYCLTICPRCHGDHRGAKWRRRNGRAHSLQLLADIRERKGDPTFGLLPSQLAERDAKRGPKTGASHPTGLSVGVTQHGIDNIGLDLRPTGILPPASDPMRIYKSLSRGYGVTDDALNLDMRLGKAYARSITALLVEAIPLAVLVDVDAVVTTLAPEGGKMLTVTDLRECRPPWPISWIEWTQISPKDVTQRCAVLSIEDTVVPNPKINLGPGQTALTSLVFVWHPEENVPCGPEAMSTTVLDATGTPVWVPAEDGTMSFGAVACFDTHGDPAYRRSVVDVCQIVPLCVFEFANCRNVELVPAKLNRQQRRTAEREGREPVVHHTLQVRPFGKRYAGQPVSQGGAARRQHICRGHYATWTKEKPLFGKHVGRWWVPMHVRGNRAVGQVEKDYRLVP